MATHAQKLKVGLFVLVCIALIVSGIALIRGYRRGHHVDYEIEFDESVLGLYVGGYVMYLGVPVGKVQDISVTDDNLAHVDIKVNVDKVTLREGVEAQLVMYSIATGSLSISLSGGEPGTPPLKPGAKIPTQVSLLSSVSGNAGDLLENINNIANILEKGLAGMEEGQITMTINELHELIKETRTSVASTQATINNLTAKVEPGIDTYVTLAGDLQQVARKTDALLAEIHGKLEPVDLAAISTSLGSVLKSVDSLVTKITQVSENMNTATANVLHDADDMEYQIRETLKATNEALEAIRLLADYLQQDPSAIVRGRGEKRDR